MIRIFCLLIGYCFGMFQTAFILGKINGIDIRKTGSGNAGTTNMLRTLGLRAGLTVAFCDIGKCMLAVLVTWLIFGRSHPEMIPLLKIYTSAGVIIGHDFPFYMNFKGGKGIAAMGGMIFSFGDPRLTIGGLILFFGLFFLTHYVSLSSLSISIGFLIGVIGLGQTGGYDMLGRITMEQPLLNEMYIILGILTIIAFYGHRANIKRLLTGTERKTYLRSKQKQQELQARDEQLNAQKQGRGKTEK